MRLQKKRQFPEPKTGLQKMALSWLYLATTTMTEGQLQHPVCKEGLSADALLQACRATPVWGLTVLGPCDAMPVGGHSTSK